MLNKLIITNFQSHENTELELNPGVNVIIGSSDSGKSAILRALNWLLKNRPSGNAYQSTWGGTTMCHIEAPEGVIEHLRDNSGARYIINHILLKAMGTDVPEEIDQLLRFDMELNLQYQHDAPFGLSFTSGEMAKLLNRIVKLDTIDKALSNVDSMKRKEKSKVQQIISTLQDKKEQLKEYEGIEAINKELCIVEEMDKEWEDKIKKLELIENLVLLIEPLQETLLTYKDTDTIEQEILLLEERIGKQKKVSEEAKELFFLLEDIEEITTSISTLIKKIEVDEPLFHERMGEMCPLCGQKIVRNV